MRLFKLISASILTGILVAPSLAQAQDVSVRVEGGVAIPLTDPQSDRFDVGGAGVIKPEIGIGSYFSVGPSLGIMAFPSDIDGVDPGLAIMLGGFARLKRPHDEENTGEGFSAISPWVDADLQYVRTGPLNRFGYAFAVGAALPTDSDRNIWIGPFVRYQNVFQDEHLTGYNDGDAHTLIAGMSFEFGPSPVKRQEPAPEPEKPVAPPVKPPVQPAPQKPTFEDVDMNLKQVIQFAWDSAVLDRTATAQLEEVVSKLKEAKSFKAVKVEGHASSEGQVVHNNKLSQRRADAVLEFLVSHGVPREKLSAVGFGSKVPVADNKTEATRVPNRRAEFVVNFVIVKEVK